MKQLFIRIKNRLSRFSFRTGIIITCACALCYAISFLQMLLPISVTAKGIIWFIFFGLAKTLQYTAILILGAAGVARLKAIIQRRKPN